MQQIIQKITQNLIDRLPENDQYYRVDKLRSLEFPSFIVRRIRVELKRNLADSMIIPKTDWINTNSDRVLDAWQQFIDAIDSEARLPASYAQAVIETAVSDVVEMLVRPRKSVPDIIYGSDDKLSAPDLHQRLQAVVVYRHFAVLVSRYVEKKEIDQLTKERCKKIIVQSDKKLTANYSPLNWAQLLEPLFLLLDGEIDTNLLRLFFEDKNKPQIARKFDLMDSVLSRAELIEKLSSPEMLDFKGHDEEQSSLFKDQPTSDRNEKTTVSPLEDENNEAEEKTGGADQQTSKKRLKNDQEQKENESSHDEGSELATEDNPQEEQPDLKAENTKEEREKADAESQPQELNTDGSNAEFDDTQNSSLEHEEGERPIWMRFMSDEEIEEYKKQQDEEEASDDGFIEEPIIDLTQEDATDEEIDTLLKMLSDDRELFVEEIFRGSDRAFEQAVEDIAAYDSWRDVSKYIEKDIFKRNLVDMYSEAAVDFTDRLQGYFLKKQNRN